MAVGRRKKTKPVNVPVALLDRVDEIKESESTSYVSRDEFVRSAVRRLVEREEQRMAVLSPVCEECGEKMVGAFEVSANPRGDKGVAQVEDEIHCPLCGHPNTIDEETSFERVTGRDRQRLP